MNYIREYCDVILKWTVEIEPNFGLIEY